jgi:tRNA dimethylallyltransferase
MGTSFARACWFLTGPTASGKTAVGIELAEAIGAEIVSLDSMAVYRGMDIGTAKPTAAQRQRVPHHLIDVRNPDEEFSVYQYMAAATETVAEIQRRKRQVLFVGGTPLYLKALLRGLFRGPSADWNLRQEIYGEVTEVGAQALHDRLALVDPLSAKRLHPNDTRRLIRALEVFRLAGLPISHLQEQFEEGERAEACRVFVLQWPRPQLHQRIEQRVEWMFAAGFVDEVRRLTDAGRTLGRSARQAVGYREVRDYLTGLCDLAACRERVKARTRRFAKRQQTWFRSLSECRNVPLEGRLEPRQSASRIVRRAAAAKTP